MTGGNRLVRGTDLTPAPIFVSRELVATEIEAFGEHLFLNAATDAARGQV